MYNTQRDNDLGLKFCG